MKIEIDKIGSERNRIDGYTDSSVIINGDEYSSSLILSPSEINPNWAVPSFHDLASQHIASIISLQPEIIILGTGRTLHFPDPEIITEIFREKIGFEVMDTGAACRCYNLLLSEDRKVAAGLIMEKTVSG